MVMYMIDRPFLPVAKIMPWGGGVPIMQIRNYKADYHQLLLNVSPLKVL